MALGVLRIVVLSLFVWSTLVAVGSWALRTQRINPFGWFGRFVRASTDPVLSPIETWQLKRGGNPQHAGWWLLGIALAGGIVLLSATEWILGTVVRLAGAAHTGPRSVIRMVAYYGIELIAIALVVRVIGSWFGAGRFNPWTRWSYKLTEWIIEPLRKIIPPIGIIDVTPLVAWFLIQFLLLPLVLRLL